MSAQTGGEGGPIGPNNPTQALSSLRKNYQTHCTIYRTTLKNP